jgi:heat shock protein HslJ
MRVVVLLAVLLGLIGEGRAAPGWLSLAVDLTYRERVVLPPGSVGEVVLTAEGREIARASLPAGEAQVPLRLVLRVPADEVRPGLMADLSATLRAPGDGMVWSGLARITLDPGVAERTLAPMVLARGLPRAAFACGDVRVEVLARGDAGILLRLKGVAMPLDAAEAGSGSRYTGTWAGQPAEFREHQGKATLSIGARRLPECTAAAPVGVFAASGNEPFWSLRVVGREAILAMPGAPPRRAALAAPRDGVQAGLAGDAAFAVAVEPGPCRDSMSGVAHPERVRVTLGDRTLEGCGGMLAARLTGAAWTLAEIAGAKAAGEKPVTLHFEEGGQLAGQGACNRFGGAWRLDGERLVIGRMFSTMMACAEPAMAQDMALFRLLETARAWRIGEQGELVIEGEGGRVVGRR